MDGSVICRLGETFFRDESNGCEYSYEVEMAFYSLDFIIPTDKIQILLIIISS